MVTIKAIAERTGVSIATVSRVMTHHPYVREEVRDRVQRTMDELAYQPNRVARRLRGTQSNIVGLIMPDIQNPFFLAVVDAVEKIAAQREYALFVCNTDEEVEKEELYVRVMQLEKVAGVIISPARERDAPARKLLEANVPMVVIDRRLADARVDTVVVDNARGTFQLISHLIKAGHTRIGALQINPVITTGRERSNGYIAALNAHHVPVHPELICVGSTKEQDGFRFTRHLLDLPQPPTAIFASNNQLLLGALRAIGERGMRIPDDVALVGFDKIAWMSSVMKPALTVVSQPTYMLGKTAVELLLRRIDEPGRPVQEVMLQTTLEIGQSCCKRHGTMPASDTALEVPSAPAQNTSVSRERVWPFPLYHPMLKK